MGILNSKVRNYLNMDPKVGLITDPEERLKTLTKLKSMLRALLLPEKAGIRVVALPFAYRDIVGADLNVQARQLGFSDLDQLYRSMRDVLRLSTNKFGEPVYMGVPDEKTQHIADLVAK